jgi:hypothetical protein
MRISLFVAIAFAGCGESGTTKPDAPSAGIDAPGVVPPIDAPLGTWTWVPIDGMKCGNGSPSGIGVNLSDASNDVMIFFSGGGACWDATTCFTTNTAVHVHENYTQQTFETEIGSIGGAFIFQRAALGPFKDASWVFVPYCTGDLHDGNNVAMYSATQVVHHVGRTNTSALVARVAATRPNAARVWLVGVSAGGYGVGFVWDLARLGWPQGNVHALGDSSPLVAMEPALWTTMQASWQLTFPSGCTDCTTDLGAMPAALRATARAGERYGVLAFTRDQVISSYFGITMDVLQARTLAMQSAMSAGSGQAAYLMTGTNHVLLGSPNAQTSTGVTVSSWVAQWASGDVAWANAGP